MPEFYDKNKLKVAENNAIKMCVDMNNIQSIKCDQKSRLLRSLLQIKVRITNNYPCHH